MNILRKIFFVKSQTHCKRYSEVNIFFEGPDSLRKKSVTENILCQEEKNAEENIFCEERDTLQTKFLAENILCQEKIF